jgi:hypothetical protein
MVSDDFCMRAKHGVPSNIYSGNTSLFALQYSPGNLVPQNMFHALFRPVVPQEPKTLSLFPLPLFF